MYIGTIILEIYAALIFDIIDFRIKGNINNRNMITQMQRTHNMAFSDTLHLPAQGGARTDYAFFNIHIRVFVGDSYRRPLNIVDRICPTTHK